MKKALAIVTFAALLGGCTTAYYKTMEKFGIEKRDILVDRVEEARDAQQEGQEQFRDALEQYRSVIAFEGGELEKQYNKLKDEYEDSKEAADKIRKRVDAIEDVANDLFDEWEEELETYTNNTLKRDSERKLRKTRANYERLIAAMRKSEERLDPALQTMHDQVLYLKHNLNAQAIASLEREAATVTRNVDALLESMQQSIAEANAFLEGIKD
jgi:hypothetical protein